MKIREVVDKDLFGSLTSSPTDIAKKHSVDISTILSQMETGIEIELEHTSSEKVAREIALDHLNEIPDYYTRLNNMEKDAGI